MHKILLAVYIILMSYSVIADDLQALERKALSGDTAVQVALGGKYFYIDRMRDYTKAKEYFELAAAKNDPEAQTALAKMYKNATGVKRDFAKANYYLELASNQGFAEAYLVLGSVYRYGLGVDQNFNKAAEYYQKAIDAGDTNAATELSWLNYYCLNFKNEPEPDSDSEQDISFIGSHENVKDLLELAASAGDTAAMIELGKMYYYGTDVEQSFTSAYHYFELASQNDDKNASRWLGLMYLKANGVTNDYSKAKDYLELSAKHGDSIAQYELGKMYKHGLGVKTDYLKSFEYFKAAAEQENAYAQYEVGMMYKDGLGVQEDFRKAKSYLLLASIAGIKNAENQLNIITNHCLNYKNYPFTDLYQHALKAHAELEIAKVLEYAAYQGNQYAQFKLGKIFYEGNLAIKPDYKKAKIFFELAANQGHAEAQYELGGLYHSGKGVTQDMKKAKEYYELAFKQNNAGAQMALGILNQYGYVNNTIEYKKALEYYSLAAKQGLIKAKTQADIITHYCLDEKIAKGITNEHISNYKFGYQFSSDENQSSVDTKLIAKPVKWNDQAQFQLGKLYYPSPKAKHYFELSASNKNTEAMFYLGEIYHNPSRYPSGGYGTEFEIDYAKAKEYYQAAADNGIEKATHALQDIYIDKCLGIPVLGYE